MPMDGCHDLRHAKHDDQIEEQLNETGAAILVHKNKPFRSRPAP